MNTNDRYLNVSKSALKFHKTLQRSVSFVQNEVKHKTTLYIKQLPNRHVSFHNYTDHVSEMECLACYHELIQIMHPEILLEVALKLAVQHPENWTIPSVISNFANDYCMK